MKTTQPPIINVTTGKAVEANDEGATLAIGDYVADLGGADLASIHCESKDAVLAATVDFDTSNRADAVTHAAEGWGAESRLGTVTFAAAVRTEVVSVFDNGAQRCRARIHVTAQGKLLLLRRGGL